VRTRRDVDDDEVDDDDDSMKDAETNRDDNAMNNLSGIDRRDLFRKKSFSDEIHLENCCSND
jgi:hypothetical protein